MLQDFSTKSIKTITKAICVVKFNKTISLFGDQLLSLINPTVLRATDSISSTKIIQKEINSILFMNLGSCSKVIIKIDRNSHKINRIFSTKFQFKLSVKLQLNIIRISVMTHSKKDSFWRERILGNIISLCLMSLQTIAPTVNKTDKIRQGIIVESFFMCGNSTIPINILAKAYKNMAKVDNYLTDCLNFVKSSPILDISFSR